jgi:hypothetical protein
MQKKNFCMKYYTKAIFLFFSFFVAGKPATKKEKLVLQKRKNTFLKKKSLSRFLFLREFFNIFFNNTF